MHTYNIPVAIAATMLVLALAAGCTADRANREIRQGVKQGQRYLEQAAVPTDRLANTGLVNVENKPWITDESIRNNNGTALPPELLKPDAITFISQKPLTLRQIFTELTQLTRLRFTFTGATSTGSANAASARNPISNALDSAGSAAAFPAAFQSTTADTSFVADTTMTVNWPGGPANGLFDLIAGRFNLAWRYEHGAVEFSLYETRTFTLNALPTDLKLQNKFDTSQSGASSSAQTITTGTQGGAVAQASTTTDTSDATLKIWDQIKDALTTIIDKQGRFSISAATGVITVTAAPDKMQRVAEYIHFQNDLLMRQVAIGVSIFAVSLDHTDDYGTNFQLFFKKFFPNGLPLAFNSPLAGPLGLGVILPSSGTSNPTQAFLQAKSGTNDTRVLTSSTVITLNNVPAPVQVGTQTAYLASTSTNLATNAGSTTSLTPGVVTSGTTLNVLPRILSHGRILLEFTAQITALQALNTVTSGQQSIQVPTVDTRNFFQRVYMHSGQTLVLAGFGQDEADKKDNGVIWPENILTGGEINDEIKHIILVIFITPTTLPGPGIVDADSSP